MIEIDITLLNKAEKRIWVKPTAKRKGHYRKIKGAKKEVGVKSAIDRLRSIIPDVYLDGATESQLESITIGVEETIGEFPDVKINSVGWSTPDDEMLYGTPDAAYLPPTRGNPNTRIIVRKEVATDIAAWSGRAEEKFDIRKEVNIDYFHDMIKGYGGWGDPKQAEEYEEKLKNINACSRLFVALVQEDKLKAIIVHECYHAIDVQMKLENIFLDQLKSMGVTKLDEMMVSDYAASKETELWAEVGSAIDSGVDIPDSVRRAFENTMGTIR